MSLRPKFDLENCPNCEFPLPEAAHYCPACGQRRTDGRITFREMMTEFADALFNLDSRLFNTIFALFIPGKLTNEYFLGKHKRYLHPLRIFLFMTIGLIAAATFGIGDPDFMGIGDEINRKRAQHDEYTLMMEVDSSIELTAKEFPSREVRTAMDSLKKDLFTGRRLKSSRDSLDLARSFNFTGFERLMIAWTDLDNLSPDSILTKYGITSTKNRLLVGQQIRLATKGQNFGFYLIGNGSWMVFFMMPFLALFLKLLYYRRGYYYVEHIIFSFHTHSFAFLLYIIMILFGGYAPGWIIGGGFVVLIIYLYIAMLKVYKQGKIKTFIKYILINTLYILVLSMAVACTALLSFALF